MISGSLDLIRGANRWFDPRLGLLRVDLMTGEKGGVSFCFCV